MIHIQYHNFHLFSSPRKVFGHFSPQLGCLRVFAVNTSMELAVVDGYLEYFLNLSRCYSVMLKQIF